MSTGTFNTSPATTQAQNTQENIGSLVTDLMDLFRSNDRGYGVGEFRGARFDEDKQKWYPGGVRWVWGETTIEQWQDHLTGVRLLGQGVLCDNNKVWYACLDIDIYDVDYKEEMTKIKNSGLPLVVFRTKSGGLRGTLFFCEGIDAELVTPRMRKIAATLGYAGCEIFPKQTKLDVSNGDCPSWIFMPYGGTGDGRFPEQGCMDDNGNLITLSDAIALAKQRRLTQDQLMKIFEVEETAKKNGKTNGRKHPGSVWVEEDTYEKTVDTMFHDGAMCLWIIARSRYPKDRNTFLLNAAKLLKWKYEENWENALTWVNFNILQPAGDRDKLNDMVKRMKSREKPYNYTCKDEPLCSHCFVQVCRDQKYGVGKDNDVHQIELGLTIVETIPARYYVNVGDKRLALDPGHIKNQDKFQEQHLVYGEPPPTTRKKVDYEDWVRRGFETATRVPPPSVLRTNATELDILTKIFSFHIPKFMRRGEQLKGDVCRVREGEKRVYFKEGIVVEYCRSLGSDYERKMRLFLAEKCQYHGRTESLGRWWRSTYSIGFDVFSEEKIEEWLSAGDLTGSGGNNE